MSEPETIDLMKVLVDSMKKHEPTTDAGLRLTEDRDALWKLCVALNEATNAMWGHYGDEYELIGVDGAAYAAEKVTALFRALSRALVDRDTGMSVKDAETRQALCAARADCQSVQCADAARVLRAVRGTEK